MNGRAEGDRREGNDRTKEKERDHTKEKERDHTRKESRTGEERENQRHKQAGAKKKKSKHAEKRVVKPRQDHDHSIDHDENPISEDDRGGIDPDSLDEQRPAYSNHGASREHSASPSSRSDSEHSDSDYRGHHFTKHSGERVSLTTNLLLLWLRIHE